MTLQPFALSDGNLDFEAGREKETGVGGRMISQNGVTMDGKVYISENNLCVFF